MRKSDRSIVAGKRLITVERRDLTVEVQRLKVMLPLDPQIHYGDLESHVSGDSQNRDDISTHHVQMELFPKKLQILRSKLNQKAREEPKFRFYTLYDRVYRMDVLEAAWKRIGRKGKAAGVDDVRAEDVLEQGEEGVNHFLSDLQEDLKSKTYRPSPVLRVEIPKSDGTMRPLGIPTLRDKVVQMAVVIILEPIYEADFLDCSYGFRPSKRAHDALE